MDTQDRPAGVRGPAERLSVNSREIDWEKEPTSLDTWIIRDIWFISSGIQYFVSGWQKQDLCDYVKTFNK